MNPKATRTERTEVGAEFFAGWPAPGKDWTCHTAFEQEWGPTRVTVTAGERRFSAEFHGTFRSPYNPYVLQVDFAALRHWDDGTPMTPAERRQVARKILDLGDCQLYTDGSEGTLSPS